MIFVKQWESVIYNLYNKVKLKEKKKQNKKVKIVCRLICRKIYEFMNIYVHNKKESVTTEQN